MTPYDSIPWHELNHDRLLELSTLIESLSTEISSQKVDSISLRIDRTINQLLSFSTTYGEIDNDLISLLIQLILQFKKYVMHNQFSQNLLSIELHLEVLDTLKRGDLDYAIQLLTDHAA